MTISGLRLIALLDETVGKGVKTAVAIDIQGQLTQTTSFYEYGTEHCM
jgi:hypothetical protein